MPLKWCERSYTPTECVDRKTAHSDLGFPSLFDPKFSRRERKRNAKDVRKVPGILYRFGRNDSGRLEFKANRRIRWLP
jgi:hypothetical protein